MQSTQLTSHLPSSFSKSEKGEKTIRVDYQQALNLITVRGSSIADHSSYKYDDLVDKIESHFKLGNSLQLYFNFDFLDNSALAYLGIVISTLNEYHDKGKMVKAFWSCLSVADNMNDEGEKLKALSKFEFHH